MPQYKITLVHKVKDEVEASSPEDAVKKAQENVKELPFTPESWTVKQVEDED